MDAAGQAAEPCAGGVMEERLSRKDFLHIGIGVVVVAAAVLTIGKWSKTAFPEASIRFEVSRGQARAMADSLLADLGLDTSGYMHAESFIYDGDAKIFIEREVGLADSDSAFTSELRFWRWNNRWFKPLQREEFRVSISTEGQLGFFLHKIPEEAEGASVSQDSALAIAEAFLEGPAGIDLSQYRLVGSETEKKPNRTDYRFIWDYVPRKWADAPLRMRVSVQGDAVGSFWLGLHVPERWMREYRNLRTRNMVTGQAATVLVVALVLGAVGVFILNIVRRRVKWRLVLGLVAATFALSVASQLNSFNLSLIRYDTTSSFSAWLSTRLAGIVVQGLLMGLLVGALAGGAEPLYRSTYPQKMYLGAFFTPRGWRTKRFFTSLMLGYGAAAVFLAYQVVFYKVAQSLGAWAPIDVPYTELLNTSLPVLSVLFIGFFPAFSEELTSRMFAIPALARLFRSAAVGVIVAAFTWGFAHASYPQQPFYIRGLEVGFAGVLISLLMLRTNVFVCILLHFGIDAFYSAWLLIRSGQPGMVASGLAGVGIMLLPFLYALLAYLRHRRFESPEEVLNGAVEGQVAVAHPVKPAPEEEQVPAYIPVEPRRWGLAFLLLGLAVALSGLLPGDGWKIDSKVHITASQARDLAREWAARLEAPVDSLLFVPHVRAFDGPAAYIGGWEAAGPLRTSAVLAESLSAYVWEVRGVRPLSADSWEVGLDAEDGALVGIRHTLPEDEPGDSLSATEARRIAYEEACDLGFCPEGWREVVGSKHPRPRRVDYDFFWYATDSSLILGDGHVRVMAFVGGSRPLGAARDFRLPEAWSKRVEEKTGLQVAKTIALLGAALLALLSAITALRRERPEGRLQWRFGLTAGLIGGFSGAVSRVLEWPMQLYHYDTARPFGLFVVNAVLIEPLFHVLLGILLGFLLAGLCTVFPSLKGSFSRQYRAEAGKDALLAGLLGLGLAFLIPRLTAFLVGLFGAPHPPLSLRVAPQGFVPFAPVLTILAGMPFTFLVGGVLAGFLLFIVGYKGRLRLLGLTALILFSIWLAPRWANTPAQALPFWLRSLVTMGIVGLLIAGLLRDRPLAFASALFTFAAAGSISGIIEHPAGAFTGVAAFVLFALGWAFYLLWPMRQPEGQGIRADSSR